MSIEVIQPLEARRLLASVPAGDVGGVITSDTEWLDTSAPYNTVADLTVQDGATLTIGPGVTVRSLNGTTRQLRVADGSLNTDSAQLFVTLQMDPVSGGSMMNTSMRGDARLESADASAFSFAGNTFSNPVTVASHFVEGLTADNSIAAFYDVGVVGPDVTTDQNWPALSGLKYLLDDDVRVIGGATLTLEPGLKLGQTANYHSFNVARDLGDGAGGIIADNVTFEMLIGLDEGISGSVTNSIMSGLVLRDTGATGFVFDNNVVTSKGHVYPDSYAGLANNSVQEVFVRSGTIAKDTVWPELDVVTNIRVDTVRIVDGATLTLPSQPLVRDPHANFLIGNESSTGGLIADAIDIRHEVYFADGAFGSITNSTFHSHMEMGDVGLLTLSDNLITDSITMSAPRFDVLQGNNLHGDDERIFMLPGAFGNEVDVPYLDGRETIFFLEGFTIDAGGSLAVAPGMTLASSPTQQGITLNGSAGPITLQLDNVTFAAQLHVVGDVTGTIVETTFDNSRNARFWLYLDESADVQIDNVDFSTSAVLLSGSPESTVDLSGNYWGSIDVGEINRFRILDRRDDPSRPLALIEPFIAPPPTDVGPHVTLASLDLDGAWTVRYEVAGETLYEPNLEVYDAGTSDPADVPHLLFDQTFDGQTTVFTWTPAAGAVVPAGAYAFRLLEGSFADADGVFLQSNVDFTATYLPGDANGDLTVDLSDFVILRNNFGRNAAAFYQADFNHDNVVDLADFVLLRNAFGQSLLLSDPGDDDDRRMFA